MTAIGYVRVSTERQAASGLSIEAQRRKVAAQAVVSDAELVEVVIDSGASAKTLHRPGWDQVMQAVTAGQVDVVIVAKLDRATRSVADLGAVLDAFAKARRADGGRGVALVSCAESLDTSTAAGRLVVNVLGAVGQWEREAIGGTDQRSPAGEAPPGSPALQRQPLRVPLVRRSPRGGCRRAAHARHDRQLPLRRSVVGQGRRRAERCRVPHAHRGGVDPPGMPADPRTARELAAAHHAGGLRAAGVRHARAGRSPAVRGEAVAHGRPYRCRRHAAIMPSRLSLAINSSCEPVPLVRLQNPHRSW